MNKVILIGRLAKDPELNTTSTGVSVCRFSIAVQRKYTNSEGEKETDFFNCNCWRNLAENAHKFLRKGSQVSLVGSIQTRSYDAQYGTKRYVTEIMVDEIEFISSPKGDEGAKESTPSQAPKGKQEKFVPIQDDDLPF